ncbi:MAG: twin-arginine translocase subunit TatC [Bacillota bacterium]|jgi:sec-independent protein translocase protein TatC
MKESSEATVYDHLGELRKRLIWSASILLLALVAGIVAAKPIVLYLKHSGPAQDLALHVFSPWDGVRIYVNVAFAVAVLLALPFLLWQLWLFVSPGLRTIERNALLKYLPFVFVLGLSGAAFAYFLIFPMAFEFSTALIQGVDLQETYGIAQYFSFMFNLIIPMALLFQMPIVVLFLTTIGLLNPDRLGKFRKYAYFLLYFVATLITPPDIISDVLVTVPMIMLYEISVLLSRRTYRNLNR